MKKSQIVSVRAGVILALGCLLGFNPILRAQVDDLKLVPPESVPASGTFYSLQKVEDQPPWPFDPFADLPVYWLGDGLFLIDDSSVDYGVWQEQAAFQSEETSQPESAQAFSSGVGAGCGLWLSISASNDVALLTLHNTRTGQTYTVWSTEDISVTITNWSVETNVTGASGDFTETLIAMGQRSNLFLRASESRDYVTNTVFHGLSFTNTRATVADTMGAVGPNHFVELLNGVGTNTAIAVYDKSGTLISQTSMTNFFAALGADGTNYPTGNMADPRILYDHQSQRWVASAIQPGPNIAIVAVSNGDSPTNLATGWTKYVIRVDKDDGSLADYDTLGLDPNGIYLSVLRLYGTNAGHTIMAIKKPEIYQGTNFSTRIEVTNDLTSWTIQPAVNFDDVPTNGYAWFVAKGPPELSTNYQGGSILYRRLQWQATNAVWADTNWVEVSNSGPTYQDYYELAGTNIVTQPLNGISAPQLGTTNGINLYAIGSRLMMAVVQNGFLWTCHTVGLNGTNGVYLGDSSGTNVDRSAMQWFKIEINSDSSGLTLGDHGRVFDPTITNAWWYYFPSLAVNCAGDMVAGFSGSTATNYVGAFYTWRLSNGSMLDQPQVIQSGTTNVSPNSVVRWGDYSATTLDPTDDWSFWTVQEYATPLPGPFGNVSGRWGTVVARIRPSP